MTARLAALAAALLLAAPAAAQSLSLDLGGEGGFGGRALQLVLLLTVLSIAPGLLMTVTAFTRIVVVLSLLRTGFGTPGAPPNVVMISLALFLTFFVMGPTFETAWRDAVQPLQRGEITETQAIERGVVPFRAFMTAHSGESELALFADLSGARPGAGPPPLTALMPAFLLSELKRAFEIGFLLLMPLLVIDLVVAAVLMAMGMMMLPPVTVSLPLKLVFFVLVDGWTLVAGSLVRSYGGG